MKESIKKLCVSPDSTVRTIMRTITRAGRLKLPVGIVLVTDPDGTLAGVVTEGDIRRSMVKGCDLETRAAEIMVKHPITVTQGDSADEMIKTVLRKVRESGRIRDYKVDKVIVVDRRRRVVDLIAFDDLRRMGETRHREICVVGTGYVGLTLALTLAEAGFKTIGIDRDRSVVARLNRAESPFYERGLQPLLKLQMKAGNLKFAARWIANGSDVYIICVGTPVRAKTRQPDFGALAEAAKDVGKVLKKDDIVILRSTVPTGTTRGLVQPLLEQESGLKAGEHFYLAFAPERVVEGRALDEIKEIPQILGGVNRASVEMAGRIFQAFNPSIVALDSLEEAEMIKLINNSFRDLSFAFANKIAVMCDLLGLDAVKVIKAANEGYPRNPVAMPSPGVGGYCLTKDPYLMARVAVDLGLSPDLFLQSRKTNEDMPTFVAGKVTAFLRKRWSAEKRLKIYVLGFAFKGTPETSDMRGSPTIDILDILRRKLGTRASFFGFDPAVRRADIEALGVTYAPYRRGFRDAHAVLILNNNPEFSRIDVYALLATMKRPGLLFDGWRLHLPQEARKIEGIVYQGLGGGSR